VSGVRLLALDVTGPGAGAALLDGSALTTRTLDAEVRRGRSLVPEIAALLREGGLRPGDLDAIACGVGPGSFTGIRIGVATAAAMAWAAGLRVVDIGSLHGIAANAPPEVRVVLVALNARRGRVFAARFDRDASGSLAPVGGYLHAAPTEVVTGLPRDAFVLGDGREAFPEMLGAYPGTADAPVRPDEIARLAVPRVVAGETRAPDELRPLYLRLSDPELRRGPDAS